MHYSIWAMILGWGKDSYDMNNVSPKSFITLGFSMLSSVGSLMFFRYGLSKLEHHFPITKPSIHIYLGASWIYLWCSLTRQSSNHTIVTLKETFIFWSIIIYLKLLPNIPWLKLDSISNPIALYVLNVQCSQCSRNSNAKVSKWGTMRVKVDFMWIISFKIFRFFGQCAMVMTYVSINFDCYGV